jgi:CubicO group peptidase (beta-lactamase class C family)
MRDFRSRLGSTNWVNCLAKLDMVNVYEAMLLEGIKDGVFPGACYGVFQDGKLTQGAAGTHTYEPDSVPVCLETVWDLASVSKVIGTTTATMMLVQSGMLDLDHPVCLVIPEFGQNGKEHITFRNLMVHDSGLVAFRPYHLTCGTADEVMSSIYKEKLTYETGSQTTYSDLSMILVAEAIERITKTTLDEYLKSSVFEPLGMNHTGYFRRDQQSFIKEVRRTECAPTESIETWRQGLRENRYGREGSEAMFGREPKFVQGEVHDPTATVLDGVAGHAGLFSTLGDLCLFLIAFMTKSQTIIDSDVFKMFTTRQETKSTRALGWDTKSPTGSSAGAKFGSNSFGHTGYTGTSVWCDPDSQRFSVLLTNRVNPTSKNTKILAFRPKFNELT